MKISFCLISNKPDNMFQWAVYLRDGMVKGADHELCLAHEGFSQKELDKIDEALPGSVAFRHVTRKPKFGKDGFDFTYARSISFRLAEKSDIIIITDDDLKMWRGTGANRYSTGERYADSIRYLYNKPGCGLVYHKSFLGGSPFGRKVLPMDGGFMETGVGMVMRARDRPFPFFSPHYLVPGLGQDWSMGATALEHGYYPAKAFNTPGRYNRQTQSGNFRERGMVRHDGPFGVVSKLYGDYKMGASIPPRLKELYRLKAIEAGWKPAL